MSEPALIPELYCTDIKKTLDFYINVLGFKILYDRPESFFAMIERQGTHIMIEQLSDNERKWISGELKQPFGRGVSFQIKTNHVDYLYEDVKKNGAPLFMKMEEKWYRADDIEVGNK